MAGGTIIASEEALYEPFREAEKPASQFRIGTEQEKPGVRTDGSPVPFEDPAGHGVADLLTRLAARHGWTPERETEAGPVLALRRDDASITLEPGAQLELSGAPFRTVHETRAELDAHYSELRPLERELDMHWLGLGFHPLARREDLRFLPKLRYGVMQRYLPTRGSRGLDMMLRTCTVQANLDYASEADAMRKLRAAIRVQPITTAMFANSPFLEGRIAEDRSVRARVWLDVDPDRSGLLDFLWGDGEVGYRDYVEWALDCPMFLVKRGDRIVANTGQRFRDFLANGFGDERATTDDWTTHLNTLFPEVRLKKTLEMRGVDAQPRELVCALPALWKGLLHDETSLRGLEQLASRFDLVAMKTARQDIPRLALRAKLAGRELAEWADELLRLSAAGLARRAKAEGIESEAVYLEPLAALTRRGESPADALVKHIDSTRPLAPQLLEHATLT